MFSFYHIWEKKDTPIFSKGWNCRAIGAIMVENKSESRFSAARFKKGGFIYATFFASADSFPPQEDALVPIDRYFDSENERELQLLGSAAG